MTRSLVRMGLAVAPNLTAAQRQAVARYQAVAARVTALAQAPDGAGPDSAAARQQLWETQDALLAAFPDMTFR